MLRADRPSPLDRHPCSYSPAPHPVQQLVDHTPNAIAVPNRIASVSLSSDAALVGAYGDDCAAGIDCGSAYVYRYNGTTWAEEQKLTASDAAAGDGFGHSVSLSADRALVGAPGDDCAAGIECGSAYVFNVAGTCCISNGSCEAAGNCQENITPSQCQALGGRFFGPNVTCADVCVNGTCIPTVSQWGLVALTLVLLTAGTIVLRRRIAMT